MASDTYDSILGLLLMGTGNDNNSWGQDANNSVFSPTARAIAGINTITATTGTVDLSTTAPPAGLRLDIDHIQLLNGALTGDVTVKVPNVSKTWKFWNKTTGAYNVFVQVPNGVARTSASTPGGLVQIPQNCCVEVVCDGNGSLIRKDDAEIGTFSISGKATAGPGEVACDGTSYLRTELPDLYGKIGTTWGSVDSTHFTVPNLIDTNRFLRAGGGSGPAVGTYQANQNLSHTHTATSTLSGAVTDSQGAHTHSATSTDSGHSHGVSGGTLGGSTNLSNTGQGGTTNTVAGTTSIIIGTGYASIATTIASAGAHTHNVSGTVTTTNASEGGTEARPESAAALICIRY